MTAAAEGPTAEAAAAPAAGFGAGVGFAGAGVGFGAGAGAAAGTAAGTAVFVGIVDRLRFPALFLVVFFLLPSTVVSAASPGALVSIVQLQLLSRSLLRKVLPLPRYVTSVTQSFRVILSPFLGRGITSSFNHHPSRSRSVQVAVRRRYNNVSHAS